MGNIYMVTVALAYERYGKKMKIIDLYLLLLCYWANLLKRLERIMPPYFILLHIPQMAIRSNQYPKCITKLIPEYSFHHILRNVFSNENKKDPSEPDFLLKSMLHLCYRMMFFWPTRLLLNKLGSCIVKWKTGFTWTLPWRPASTSSDPQFEYHRKNDTASEGKNCERNQLESANYVAPKDENFGNKNIQMDEKTIETVGISRNADTFPYRPKLMSQVLTAIIFFFDK